MKNLKLFMLLMLSVTLLYAQQVDKLETKNLSSYGMKKFSEAPKKIFIQHFFVNYQMLFDQIEIAKGGREIGGGRRGDAKAQLVLGVNGVDENDLQSMTDQLYQNYVKKLTDAGYEIVSAAEVAKNARFDGWQILEGGTPSKAQFPGYVHTSPKGYKYLAKKVSKKGKVKSKGNMFDNGMGTSKDLGGIIVARFSIIVPFIKNAESQASRGLTKTFGGVAKIVVKPELRISPKEAIQTKAVIGEKTEIVYTSSLFAFKTGLKYQATLNVIPKKPVKINGVFESKKYKAVKSAETDIWGTSNGYIRIFSVDDVMLKKMQMVNCTKETYVKGVLDASQQFVDKSVSEFLKYIN